MGVRWSWRRGDCGDWREVKNKPLAIITGYGPRHPLLCLTATHPPLAVYLTLLLSFLFTRPFSLSLPPELSFPLYLLLQSSFLFLRQLSHPLSILFSLHVSLQPLSVFSRSFLSLWLPCLHFTLQTSDFSFPVPSACPFYSSSPCVSSSLFSSTYSLILSVFISPMLFLSRSAPSGVPEQVEDKLISLCLTLSHQQPSFALRSCVT